MNRNPVYGNMPLPEDMDSNGERYSDEEMERGEMERRDREREEMERRDMDMYRDMGRKEYMGQPYPMCPGMYMGCPMYQPFMYYPMQPPYQPGAPESDVSQGRFRRRRRPFDFDEFFFPPFNPFFSPFRFFDFDDFFFFPFRPFRFF